MTGENDSGTQNESVDSSTTAQNAASTRRGAMAALAGVGLLGLGTGTVSADDNHDHLGQTWSGNPTEDHGLRLEVNDTQYGLRAYSSSTSARPLFSRATASSGHTIGMYSQSDSTDGTGVYGIAPAESGDTIGVRGQADSPDGDGVFGFNTSTTGVTAGVRGRANSPHGFGVWGLGRGGADGLYGRAYDDGPNNNAAGVIARSDAVEGHGVFGLTTDLSGDNTGVRGQSASSSGTGVYGEATNSSGSTSGVYGRVDSASGVGVHAENSAGGQALQANGDATVTGHTDIGGDTDIDGDTDVGGVLTIGELGVEAYLDSDQTISNVSDTVAFNTVLTDDRNEFNTTNGNFIAAYDGTYLVTTQITWDGSTIGSNQSTSVELVHEGTTVAENVGLAQSGHDYYSLAVSKTLRNVTTSDSIRVDVSHEGSDWDLVGDKIKTWIEITQIG